MLKLSIHRLHLPLHDFNAVNELYHFNDHLTSVTIDPILTLAMSFPCPVAGLRQVSFCVNPADSVICRVFFED